MSPKPAKKNPRDTARDEEEKKPSARDEDEDEGADEDEEEEDEEGEDEEGDEEDEEEGEDEEEEGDEDEDDEAAEAGAEEPEDQYWWTPYAVLGVLVLVGLLGFFGLFNRFIKGSSAGGAAAPSGQPAAAATAKFGPPAASAMQDVKFGAKQILVQYKGAQTAPEKVTRTKDEAKARAGEALAKAKGGAKWEDVVKEYSDESDAATRGGNMGRFRKGSQDPKLEAAVEKTKVGDLGEIVESPKGFHVFLRTF